LLHVGIGDGSSDGLEDGLSLGVELYQVRIDEGSLVGFQDGSLLGVELGIDDGSTTHRRCSLEVVVGQDNLSQGSGHQIAVNMHRIAVNMLPFTNRGTGQPSFGARPVFSSGRIVYRGQDPTFP
jgi:hypothetical protein